MPISFQRLPGVGCPEQSASLWRYMSLPKFVSLLSSGLYFCNLSSLLEQDPHEGALAQGNIRHRAWTSVDDVRMTHEDHATAGITSEDDTAVRVAKFDLHRRRLEERCRIRIQSRPFISVNCWHANQDESAAMWSAYGNEGVAICSSLERLERAIGSQDEIFCGEITYRDLLTSEINLLDEWLPFTKRKSFEHEKEVRLVIRDTFLPNLICEFDRKCEGMVPDELSGDARPVRYDEMGGKSLSKHPSSASSFVKTDCSILMARCVVSPTASDLFFSAVQAICSCFGMTVDVERSDIRSPGIV